MFSAPNNELYLNWQDVQIAETVNLPLDELKTRREGAMLVVCFKTAQERDAWKHRINAAIWGEETPQ